MERRHLSSDGFVRPRVNKDVYLSAEILAFLIILSIFLPLKKGFRKPPTP